MHRGALCDACYPVLDLTVTAQLLYMIVCTSLQRHEVSGARAEARQAAPLEPGLVAAVAAGMSNRPRFAKGGGVQNFSDPRVHPLYAVAVGIQGN